MGLTPAAIMDEEQILLLFLGLRRQATCVVVRMIPAPTDRRGAFPLMVIDASVRKRDDSAGAVSHQVQFLFQCMGYLPGSESVRDLAPGVPAELPQLLLRLGGLRREAPAVVVDVVSAELNRLGRAPLVVADVPIRP